MTNKQTDNKRRFFSRRSADDNVSSLNIDGRDIILTGRGVYSTTDPKEIEAFLNDPVFHEIKKTTREK